MSRAVSPDRGLDHRQVIDDEVVTLAATWDEQERLRRRILRQARDIAARFSKTQSTALTRTRSVSKG